MRGLHGSVWLLVSLCAPAMARASGGHDGDGFHVIDMVPTFVNFLVLVLLFTWLFRDKVSASLRQRKLEVEKALEEAAALKAAAEAKQSEYTTRLEQLDQELDKLKSDMLKASKAERDRIVQAAEERAALMRREAEFLVEQQAKQLRIDLTREAVDAAMQAAEELLAKTTTPQDQQRLAEEYLAELKRTGGADPWLRPGSYRPRESSMSQGSIAKRYARAIFELADEAGQISRVGKDLEDTAGMWKASGELRELIHNPGFSSEARKQVLTDLATRAALTPIARQALLYLNDCGRLAVLPHVATEFERLSEEKAGTVRAQVISAAPLADAYIASLQRVLEQVVGKKVTVEKKTDPSLIGGVVTRVGDQVFDGSVRNRLSELGDSLRSA